MGIRRSQRKNKKNKKPALAIAVKREETIRRAAESSGRPKAVRNRKAPAPKVGRSRMGRRGSTA